MKKTFSIHIADSVFHIDEDAYEKLKDYLSKVSLHFEKEKDGREIVRDIESRIAELFTGMLSPGQNVIETAMVERVINTMGMPEDYTDTVNDENKKEENASPSSNQAHFRTRSKRLYRDPDSCIIGGVCSGLGHYWNMDKILVRILFIILFIATSGIAVPVYIILWIAIPKARTTTQRLEMTGEPVNVENIGKTVKENITDKKENNSTNKETTPPAYSRQEKSKEPGTLSKIFGIILILFGFLSLLKLIALTVLASKAIGFLPSIIGNAGNAFPFEHLFSSSTGSTFAISLLIITGIPLLLIIYFGTKLMFNYMANSRSVILSALGVWIIGIILLISTVAGAANIFSTSSTDSESNNLVLPADTIYIKMAPGSFNSANYSVGINNFKITGNGKDEPIIASPKFSIEQSRGQYIDLVFNKYAKGNNYKTAKKNAQSIGYNFSVSGDTLLLDPFFTLGNNKKWRSQNLDITLNIPENKTIYLDDNLLPIIHKADNQSGFWEGDMTGKYWIMKSDGLTLAE